MIQIVCDRCKAIIKNGSKFGISQVVLKGGLSSDAPKTDVCPELKGKHLCIDCVSGLSDLIKSYINEFEGENSAVTVSADVNSKEGMGKSTSETPEQESVSSNESDPNEGMGKSTSEITEKNSIDDNSNESVKESTLEVANPSSRLRRSKDTPIVPSNSNQCRDKFRDLSIRNRVLYLIKENTERAKVFGVTRVTDLRNMPISGRSISIAAILRVLRLHQSGVSLASVSKQSGVSQPTCARVLRCCSDRRAKFIEKDYNGVDVPKVVTLYEGGLDLKAIVYDFSPDKESIVLSIIEDYIKEVILPYYS